MTKPDTFTLTVPIYQRKIIVHPAVKNLQARGEVICKKSGLHLKLHTDYTTDPDTLAHECVHLATYTLLLAGVEADMRNDEAIAYLVGWLYKELSTRLQSWGNGCTRT